MRFSLSYLTNLRRDTRPLYRRILTNKRLDIAHKTFLRTLIGFNLFGASFCIVNTYLYFKFERPLKLERQQQLERELLEADLAGFKVK
uniref:Cytochrome c oxidase assembly factor 3 n=1 Tax=Strongyloides papillosus TaxID=174720 RepID=A0A0N5BPR5_STREA